MFDVYIADDESIFREYLKTVITGRIMDSD